MNLLLDTQIFLWAGSAPSRLGNLLPVMKDPENRLLLSAASSWEVAIKHGLGKLDLPEPPSSFVPSRMSISGIEGLEISHAHALAVAQLPLHHRDAFDRLLLAQAHIEDLTIATADPIFERYTNRLLGPR